MLCARLNSRRVKNRIHDITNDNRKNIRGHQGDDDKSPWQTFLWSPSPAAVKGHCFGGHQEAALFPQAPTESEASDHLSVQSATCTSAGSVRIVTCTESPGYKSQGQLKLSITVIGGHLTLHVLQARSLNSRWTRTCDSYVQVTLHPEESQQACCQTEVVCDSNNPTFDEKFTYELFAEDAKKRIMVSVWHKDSKRQCGEFLGCMSFGVRHLVSKTKKKQDMEGWYHLLSEDVGHRKHLLAQSTSSKAPKLVAPPSSREAGTTITAVNKTLAGMDSCTLVIHRSGSGYGFTVKGDCPVRVGRIKVGSASEQAGLKKGDYIVRINGQNVSRSSAQSIAEIVRNSTKLLVVDVHRSDPMSSSIINNTAQRSNTKLFLDPAGLPCHTVKRVEEDQRLLDENTPPVSANHYEEPAQVLNNAKSILSRKSWVKECNILRDSTLQSCSMESETRIRRQTGSHKRKPNHSSHHQSRKHLKNASSGSCTSKRAQNDSGESHPAEQRNCDSDESSRQHNWDLSMTIIPKTESRRNLFLRSTSSICDQTIFDACDTTVAWDDTLKTDEDGAAMNLGCVAPNCTLETASASYENTLIHNDFTQGLLSRREDTSAEEASGIKSAGSFEMPTLSSAFLDDTIEVADRHVAVQKLVACEQKYIHQMQLGIQSFSRPLRHCILSTQQHAMLFQNLEKLVALSECHLQQLYENSHCSETSSASASAAGEIETVGSVYQPRVRLLCSAYESYIAGLDGALNLMQDMRDYPEFANFIQKHDDMEMRMESFLHQPLVHFHNIVLILQQVLSATPSHSHPDYTALQKVVQVMEFTISKMDQTMSETHLEMPDFSLAAEDASERSSFRDNLAPLQPAQSLTSVASVDAEVMELQSRLKYQSGVKPLQLATASRHLVYSGELRLMTADGSCQALQVVLLSDMILLLKEAEDGTLHVLQEPLLLLDVVSSNFNCTHPSEFKLTFDILRQDGGVRRRAESFGFRAPDLEQKCAWKSILEHRVQICKSQGSSSQPSWSSDHIIV